MKIAHPLRGKRICLRNYTESDLSFLTDMWFDEENGAYLSDPTREYVDDAFQNALDTLGESPYGYYLVIELADSKEPIGSLCAFPNEQEMVYDIGYCIHKSHWRQGYGIEAVALLLQWLKAQGAKKVTAEVAAANLPSRMLLHKLGFTVEKETSFQKYNMNVRFDSYLYAKTWNSFSRALKTSFHTSTNAKSTPTGCFFAIQSRTEH